MQADDFRAAMRRFPTGVTLVTTILDGDAERLYCERVFERPRPIRRRC